MTTALRPGTFRRLVVDVECLSCGASDTLTVIDLRRLPPFPRPCDRCGGSQLATAAQLRTFVDPDYIPPLEPDDTPRRGRPAREFKHA